MSCVVLLLYEKKHKKQKMQINIFEGPGSSVKLHVDRETGYT